jgi:tetratricopeptide (TPR) repeat protein
MPELKAHLDDFTLLRYVAGDLEEVERDLAACHIQVCTPCSDLLGELRRLDTGLRDLAEDPDTFGEPESPELPTGDPFRRRPEVSRPVRHGSGRLVERAIAASERGLERRESLLEAVGEPRWLKEALERLSLSDAGDRYALLYALQETGQRIAESPVRARRFAEEALTRLRRPDAAGPGAEDAAPVRMVPQLGLVGQAHLLAGQACNWMGEYDVAWTHFQLAYSSFAPGGDEVSLALVEHLESQRRFFVGLGEEALVLARRAAATFEAYGLEDTLARARVSEGMALLLLGRAEEALEVYRGALAVFESRSLWSNYVGVLNNVAVCLVELGRLDEARREYARALRRLSRDEHRSFLAFIRHGLAEVLFAAGHYREAARSLAHARRLYEECGLRANVLTAWLFEAESWARSGDLARARDALEACRGRIAGDRSLDPSVARQVEDALSGLDPDFRNIAQLRHQAEAILPRCWRGMSA